MSKEQIYKVNGMHCASCEILIEKRLLEIDSVKSVEASTSRGEVVVEYEGNKPNEKYLNNIFRRENYSFFEKTMGREQNKQNVKKRSNKTWIALDIALFFVIAFLLLNKLGLSGLLSVNSKSSVIAFFGFGLLAGISSCAALVGGMILSMSKQWYNLYGEGKSTFQKLQPHLIFNAGRLISYAVLGGVLGAVGSSLQISFKFTSFLIIAISFLMVVLGLQMLGVKAFRRFQFALPKSATRYIASENNFKGKYMPFIMGALTFFLPCGFTITSQGLALISGSPVQGALIMFAFALGTAPMLLFIGFSSIKFSEKPHLSEQFSKVAGFLVLFFALFNFNSQLNVLGYTSVNNLFISPSSQVQTISVDESGLPPIVDGKQVIKMNASAKGYSPNYLKVRAGVLVRWEITDTGTSGCTNAIISKSLFPGQIDLTPGKVSVKEFTPQTPGKYKFSCWMGMVTGIIEVVPQSGSTSADTNIKVADSNSDETIIPSGASGCGCGGGGSGASSCGGNIN